MTALLVVTFTHLEINVNIPRLQTGKEIIFNDYSYQNIIQNSQRIFFNKLLTIFIYVVVCVGSSKNKALLEKPTRVQVYNNILKSWRNIDFHPLARNGNANNHFEHYYISQLNVKKHFHQKWKGNHFPTRLSQLLTSYNCFN